MDHIEAAAADASEHVDGSPETHHLRRKHAADHHQENRNASPEPPPPAPRSPDTFLEILTGNSNNDPPPPMAVEELTVNNYRIPNAAAAGGSGSGPATRQNLIGLADASHREDAGSRLFPSQFGPLRPTPLLARADDHHHHQQGMRSGIRTKMLQATGFPQFMVKSNLKGKGVAYRHQEAQGFPAIADKVRVSDREEGVGPDLSASPCAKHQDKALFGGGGSDSRDGKALFGSGAIGDSDSHDGKALFGGGGIEMSAARQDGISLREWLKQRHCKFGKDKDERLHILRQIAELVDIAHSQGLVLQNLRPSYFVIMPLNQVKYIGSLVPEDQLGLLPGSTDDDVHFSEHNLRKRVLEYEIGADLSPKYQKLSEDNNIDMQPDFPVRGSLKGGRDFGIFKKRNSESDYRKQLKIGDSYYAGNMSKGLVTSSFGGQLSTSKIMKLEKRWYASPEEISESICYLNSNIYNLGVLVFELFCYFETWEAHSAAMSDLRHRILPPNFLSESPKEASFCLWLLHPEPSFRPKSRDILTCGLVSEGRDLSSLDQSSTSIGEADAEADLLLHFLSTLKEQKEKQAAKLVAALGCLQADIEVVEQRHASRAKFLSSARDLWSNSNGIPDAGHNRGSVHVEAMSRMTVSSTNEDRLMRNIDQLENAYFSMRSKIELSETNAAARPDKDVLMIRDRCSQVRNDADALKESKDRVGTFFEGLCKYARYSRFEVCGNLRNVDILNSANVICSLSFDRDEEYFAAAGVSKKIKIFEFGSLLDDGVDIHYPLLEMSCRSRLSCVCWNTYIRNYLASTDYDGVVQLWDASTGQGFTRFTEHQKRAWSVDFSTTDPVKLASGSDDCSMKLWSINEKNCLSTIRSMANICCVQFSSYSSNLLAFGSADYKTYCYDLRNTRIPWCTLSGHGKAVSYVKFIDSETLVSASTDNTLKLWDLNNTNTGGLSTDACSLTFSGHTNEKNFVGLSVSDGYIACGSETNEVYAYYKTFPMSITSQKFGSIDPITGQETSDDNGQFVSSVCWRTKSNTVVAANSTGSIKLLQLV